MMPTVFLVDGAPETLNDAASLLEADGLRLVKYRSPKSFIKAFDPARPGCIICRDRLPGMTGATFLRHLRSVGPALPALIITEPGDVPAAVRAVKAGAMNVLEDPVDPEVLREHVRRAVRRDAKDRAARSERTEIVKRFHALSDRERQLLSLVAEGLSNREIAEQIGVSPKTIESQRANMMRKMGAAGLPQIIRMAVLLQETGNLSPPPEPPQTG